MERNGTGQPAPKPELTDEERRKLLDVAIQKNEKLAESELEMANLFLMKGKRQIAKNRLRRIVGDFAESDAAKQARLLLKKL